MKTRITRTTLWITMAIFGVALAVAMGCGSSAKQSSTTGTSTAGGVAQNGDFRVEASSSRDKVAAGDGFIITLKIDCVAATTVCTTGPLRFSARPTSVADTVAQDLTLNSVITTTTNAFLCADTCDKAALATTLLSLSSGTLDDPNTPGNEFKLGGTRVGPLSVDYAGVAKTTGTGRAVFDITVSGGAGGPMLVSVPIDIIPAKT